MYWYDMFHMDNKQHLSDPKNLLSRKHMYIHFQQRPRVNRKETRWHNK